jgi:hypothetical protein
MVEISRFMNDNRESVVLRNNEDYVVQHYEDSNMIREVSMNIHSLQYAEDCAENWVFRYGSFE